MFIKAFMDGLLSYLKAMLGMEVTQILSKLKSLPCW